MRHGRRTHPLQGSLLGPLVGRSLIALVALLALVPSTHASECSSANRLGVSRVVEIDASGGPIYGSITSQSKEESFLGPKEVVLTFDDGPMPGLTVSILDTLDRYCTKATFFSVGQMAVAYPTGIREILRRGHTLGTHTWSHPMNVPRLSREKARDQIESGFAAISMVARGRVAPFFRFPGLSDSRELLGYLQTRGIATFTVDVVSNDSYISDAGRLISTTMRHLEANGSGIMLFHDIKSSTARALPVILSELKERGYKVVHLVAKQHYAPPAEYVESVKAQVAARSKVNAQRLVSFMAAGPSDGTEAPAPMAQSGTGQPVPVTSLAAEPKDRGAAPEIKRKIAARATSEEPAREASEARKARTPVPKAIRSADATGWATTVRARQSEAPSAYRRHDVRPRYSRPPQVAPQPVTQPYGWPWGW